MAQFNRFDICAAHRALERDWHLGGWLQHRPSNRRRREASSFQLERIGYEPGLDVAAAFEYLQNDNQRAIYCNALQSFDMMHMLDSTDETHSVILAYLLTH